MVDTGARLERLLRRYKDKPRPISVNFRQMLPSMGGDRATHFLHPYPAKLLAHIPHFFLDNEVLSGAGDVVLDPFCGSGTVLLEAVLCNRNAVGVDTNPLACLLSRVKTLAFDANDLPGLAEGVIAEAKLGGDASPPAVVNIDYWFHPHVIRDLARLRDAISRVRSVERREFLSACFSAAVRRVSLADPRVSVPVKLRASRYPADHRFRPGIESRVSRLKSISVYTEFQRIVEANVQRMADLRALLPSGVSCTVSESDARRILVERNGSPRRLAARSVDMIVTSPPYPGAQKYIRACSLSLGWLGFHSATSLRDLERKNIGREHYSKAETSSLPSTGVAAADRLIGEIGKRNPLRAHIVATYLVEMRAVFGELSRVLRRDGHLVLVCGNSQVGGRPFRTCAFLAGLAEEAGLELRLALRDAITSRGLMTKRNKTASVIACEYILLFRKP